MHAWLWQPLSGRRFLAIGAALAALKVAIDYGIARGFHHPYSLLFYVDPMDAPLFHPGANLHYWMAMAALAMPFTAIGIALCVRRLHDAALSAVYVLLFFVPFAHLLFFAALVLSPSRPRPLDLTLPPNTLYREPGAPLEVPRPPPMRRNAALLAATFGAILGLGALAISVGLLRDYGAALIIGSPCITGFASGAFYARLSPAGKISGAVGAAALAIVMMTVVVVAFAIEGLFCLAILFPVYVAPALVASVVGFYAGRALPRPALDVAIFTSMLSFFVLLGLEHVSPVPALEPPPVRTEVEIDAPPETVWPLLPTVAPMAPPTDLLFRTAIAYPIDASMEGEGIGATRVCEFDTGQALEVVDLWEPGHALGFAIKSQPEPVRELTLYRTFRQPHNDGYIENTRGELRVDPLPGGRSLLTGITWYKVRLTPEAYWRGFIDLFIHRIHHRVMDTVKARAEGPAGHLLARR